MTQPKSATIKQPLGILEVGQTLLDAADQLRNLVPDVTGSKRVVNARNLIQAVLPLLNVQTKARVTHRVTCNIYVSSMDRRFSNKKVMDRILNGHFEFFHITNTIDYGSRA
jgi:hypothetical protein